MYAICRPVLSTRLVGLFQNSIEHLVYLIAIVAIVAKESKVYYSFFFSYHFVQTLQLALLHRETCDTYIYHREGIHNTNCWEWKWIRVCPVGQRE